MSLLPPSGLPWDYAVPPGKAFPGCFLGLIIGLYFLLSGHLGSPDTTSLLSGKNRGTRAADPPGKAVRRWSGPGHTRFCFECPITRLLQRKVIQLRGP